MSKSTNLNIRINPSTKENAEQLFKSFGMTISDAVNIFLHQAIMVGGLPFEVKIPPHNTETKAALHEALSIADKQVHTKGYASARVLFEELDSEC